MITRQDIENEAAWVQRLIELANPTGLNHTPTPWQGGPELNVTRSQPHFPFAINYTIAASTDHDGIIGAFYRKDDRDLALFFVNAHAAIIALLRNMAGAFDFIEMSTADDGMKNFARKQSELCRIYANLFCRLGTPENLAEDLDGKS
jgi:hypothetical protein